MITRPMRKPQGRDGAYRSGGPHKVTLGLYLNRSGRMPMKAQERRRLTGLTAAELG